MGALTGFTPGQELNLGTRRCTLAQFRLYTSELGRSLHSHAEEAAQVGLSRPPAPGGMIVAYMHEALTNVFGTGWLAGGRLSCALTAPVWSGDTLLLRATVTARTESRLELSVRMDTADGRMVLAGSASAPYR